jgi:hypothetical protein
VGGMAGLGGGMGGGGGGWPGRGGDGALGGIGGVGLGKMVWLWQRGWGVRERGATLNPKIYNTGKYDNSLYKGTSNWLVSHL